MTPQLRRAEQVRAFNRFYTKRIGLLRDGILDSPFSLPELRVLYEVAHRPGVTAGELAVDLGLDAGYISRLVRSLDGRGLVRRTPAPHDGRLQRIELTAEGQRTFAPIDRRSTEEIAGVLEKLPADAQQELIRATETIERLLDGQNGAYILRREQPGDIGWVIERHGAIYAAEYGWNQEFEVLVAEVATAFLRENDPRYSRCWIAERHGVRLGCVFLVKEDSEVARLRLLLVEPGARRMGIGRQLVKECIVFARSAGYKRIVLWTQRNLRRARELYAREGFQLTSQIENRSFGVELISETWEFPLDEE